MLCRICKKEFIITLTFGTLFFKHRICQKCSKTFLDKTHLEAIPFSDGIIDFYYQNHESNQDESFLLTLCLYIDKPLKIAISLQIEYDIIIIIDALTFDTFPTWFTMVSAFQNIMFISHFYYDFSRYETLL